MNPEELQQAISAALAQDRKQRAEELGTGLRAGAIALLVFAFLGILILRPHGGGDAAYYANGTWVRYFADPATQEVRSIDSAGDVGLDHGCVVVDAHIWTCPAVTNADDSPDWQWGAIRAVDGHMESTDPKLVTAPISRAAWEFARIRRKLGRGAP